MSLSPLVDEGDELVVIVVLAVVVALSIVSLTESFESWLDLLYSACNCSLFLRSIASKKTASLWICESSSLKNLQLLNINLKSSMQASSSKYCCLSIRSRILFIAIGFEIILKYSGKSLRDGRHIKT